MFGVNSPAVSIIPTEKKGPADSSWVFLFFLTLFWVSVSNPVGPQGQGVLEFLPVPEWYSLSPFSVTSLYFTAFSEHLITLNWCNACLRKQTVFVLHINRGTCSLHSFGSEKGNAIFRQCCERATHFISVRGQRQITELFRGRQRHSQDQHEGDCRNASDFGSQCEHLLCWSSPSFFQPPRGDGRFILSTVSLIHDSQKGGRSGDNGLKQTCLPLTEMLFSSQSHSSENPWRGFTYAVLRWKDSTAMAPCLVGYNFGFYPAPALPMHPYHIFTQVISLFLLPFLSQSLLIGLRKIQLLNRIRQAHKRLHCLHWVEPGSKVDQILLRSS